MSYVNGELSGGQSTNHEQTGTDTTERSLETKLLGDLDQAASGALSRQALALVDLREHGVGRLRDDGGGETGDDTRGQIVHGLHTVAGLVLVDDGVNGLVNLLENGELGHGVWDPLKFVSG